jgi:hypothetical protein
MCGGGTSTIKGKMRLGDAAPSTKDAAAAKKELAAAQQWLKAAEAALHDTQVLHVALSFVQAHLRCNAA